MIRYVLRRLVYMIFVVMGISLSSFALLHLIPGDPARVVAGPAGTAEAVARVRELMGLNDPLHLQLYNFYSKVVRLDFGESWFSGKPVLQDVLTRLPATVELLLSGFLIAVIIFVPLGIMTAFNPRGWMTRMNRAYSLIAGSIPDFWLGLMLILLFYVILQIVPPPMGRLEIGITPPPRITGLLVLDSLLVWNTEALFSAISFLFLPAFCLAFVMGGPIVKMTISSIRSLLDSGFIEYSRILGLKETTLRRYALKNAAPPIVTLVGVLFNYMISGAVMIEMVFSWGGLGQYAVQSIVNKDYNSVQTIIIFMAVIASLVYLTIDILYFAIDPRVRQST